MFEYQQAGLLDPHPSTCSSLCILDEAIRQGFHKKPTIHKLIRLLVVVFRTKENNSSHIFLWRHLCSQRIYKQRNYVASREDYPDSQLILQINYVRRVNSVMYEYVFNTVDSILVISLSKMMVTNVSVMSVCSIGLTQNKCLCSVPIW